MAAVPASLKSIKPYIDRAQELQAKDPVVAYHCRLYALQEAMKLRAQLPKEDMGFVLGLMDTLEAEKATLGELDSPAVLVENFAQELFQRADDADRAGRYDMRTGKAFLVASQLIDVCKQFGELPPDLAEKAKYAKWRFVEIAKATKEGRPPAPPRGVEPEEPADAGPAPPDIPPPQAEAPPPSEVPPPDPYGLPPAEPAGLPSYMGLPMPPSAPAAAPPPAPGYPGLAPAGPAPSVPSVPSVPAAMPHFAAPPPAAAYGLPPAAPPAAAYGLPPAAPGVPAAGGFGAVPGMVGMAGVPQPVRGPSFRPDRHAMCEAQRLCSSASSALQFQDHETAVHQIAQALQMLTQPRPVEPPAP